MEYIRRVDPKGSSALKLATEKAQSIRRSIVKTLEEDKIIDKKDTVEVIVKELVAYGVLEEEAIAIAWLSFENKVDAQGRVVSVHVTGGEPIRGYATVTKLIATELERLRRAATCALLLFDVQLSLDLVHEVEFTWKASELKLTLERLSNVGRPITKKEKKAYWVAAIRARAPGYFEEEGGGTSIAG